MRTFELEKLVHDRIVQDHLDEGGDADYEVITGERLQFELARKLEEERAELALCETDEERTKEQMDVNNVLYALGSLGSSDFVPTKTFELGHYIHTATVPLTSWLAGYYGSHPERFPEITHD